MSHFDILFNNMFLAIFFYHVLYFMVQYFVFKRIELFYYSIFLLSAAIYYFVYFEYPILKVKFDTTAHTVFSTFQLTFSFIQIYFYSLFIIAYLKLAKLNGRVYNFFHFYKYYNLFFIFVFLLLGLFRIESKSFFALTSILAVPLLLYALFLLYRMYTTYATIVIWGTICNILGTVAAFTLINAEMHGYIKLTFNNHIPAQIGLLLDLFILGYGLSLKAAESDKKLVQYLLENQRLLENERSRFAHDLHDGLGGMLSGIKLNLSSIKIIQNQETKLLNNLILQLDKAISEMRRVAHNLMPEALLNFGLSEAIQDYCDGINEGNAVNLKYIRLGSLQSIEKSVELMLYRMIQELSNNAIKHSDAKNILIQLVANNHLLELTVEDNGHGFNLNELLFADGRGLQNIQSRVDYLNGTFDIDSQIGIGTTINIHIPYNS